MIKVHVYLAAGGPALAILDIDISATIDLSLSFSLTLDVFDLRISDIPALETAITTSLTSTTGA